MLTTTPQPGAPWTEPTSRIELVWVPPGRFWMGSNKDDPAHPCYDPGAYDDELPGLEVEIRRGYWIGRFPVTNREYRRFLKASGAAYMPHSMYKPGFNAARHPALGVNWHDAMSFCQWLSGAGQAPPGYRFTLPTEAQWERAARGTDGRKYPWGNEDPTPKHARFDSDSTAPMGPRAQGVSPAGCYDMAGSVWEWCADTWADDLVRYKTAPGDDCYDSGGAVRVLRGGAWFCDPKRVRCAIRSKEWASASTLSPGFRLAVVSQLK